MNSNYTIFDQLQNPVVISDKSGKILYYNHICPSYFKIPPRKLNKLETISDLLIQDGVKLVELVKEVLQSKTPSVTEEIQIKLPEEDIFNTVILKFIPADQNVIIHLLDFTIEHQLHQKYKDQIEKLKSTHQQIVLSDKLTALGEMTAGISHEISTPLVVISDRLQGLEMALMSEDFEESQQKLKDLKKSFSRVQKIISNMQTFVRNQEDKFLVLKLKEVFDHSIDFLKTLPSFEKIKFKLNINPSIYVLGNEVKLQQVVINLLKNSMDALKQNISKGKDAVISVEVNELIEDKILKVEVIDNGPGILQENVDKIFEMFFTTKEMGEGTGLGLAISKKILESHQGNLKLDDSYKSGAKFILEFPIIELASFCYTNHYLQGETTDESLKILIVGNDVKKLNSLIENLHNINPEFVLIINTHFNQIEENIDFFSPNLILSFESIKKERFPNTEIIENKDFEFGQLKTILEKFGVR